MILKQNYISKELFSSSTNNQDLARVFYGFRIFNGTPLY